VLHLLHLSDLHLRSEPHAPSYARDPDRHLDAVLAVALAWAPAFDAIAATGDIAEDASEPAYRRAHRELSTTGAPVRWVPGNHDDPVTMRTVHAEGFDPLDVGSWRLVGVDSRWPTRIPGQVTSDELVHLDRALGVPGPPHCAVLVHHPPHPPCTELDCQIVDSGPLLDTIARHRVRLVLSGHMHRSFYLHRDRVAWIGAPSTCMQVTHPDHVHTTEPPAATVIHLGDDGSISAVPVGAPPEKQPA
jgi:Icc protein